MARPSFLEEAIKDDSTLNLVRGLVVESERKYRALVENANVGIYVTDASQILYVNSYLLRLTGYTLEETIGMPIDRVIDPKFLDEVMSRVQRRLRGDIDDSPTEFRLMCRDGRSVDVSGLAGKCIYEGRQAIIGTLIDLTEIKTVRAKVAHLEGVIENVPIPIIQVDLSERVSDSNSAANLLLKNLRGTLRNTPLADLLIDENPQQRITEIFLKSRRSGWNGTLTFANGTKDGIEVKASAIPVKSDRNTFSGITLVIDNG